MTHIDMGFKALFLFAFEKTKEHFWFLLGFMFLYAILTADIFHSDILGTIIGAILTIATAAVSLSIVHGHVPHWKTAVDPFRTYHVFWHYLLAFILFIAIVVIGLVVFIIPGIYFAIRLQFFPFIVVEHKHMGPIAALKKSFEMTEGHTWKLFLFTLLSVLIILAGAVLFIVGLLVAVPVVMIARAELYKRFATHRPLIAIPHIA